MKFLYVVTHQIQAHTPLFRKISQNKKVSFKAIYWQNISKNFFDTEFNKMINWGMDLTSGFNHIFLFEKETDYPKINFTFKLKVLFRLIKLIIFGDYQAICFHGYYFPHVFAAIVAKLKKKKTIMRDISYNLGKKSLLKKILRKFYYRFANMFIDEFWAIGELNSLFFKIHGVSKEKIKLIPHAINDERLLKKNNTFLLNKEETCLKYDISQNKKIILFIGKFIKKKQPLMLIEAFTNSKINDEWLLILVGDGHLKNEIELFFNSKNVKNIKLINFLNQYEIINFYNIADIFVMPSDQGETWGLAAIEAIHSGCSLIVSDMVGCHPEILKEEIGIVFDHKNKNELSNALKLLVSNSEMRQQFTQNALKYSNNIKIQIVAEKIIETLQK